MSAPTRSATVLMVANQFPKFSETFIVDKFLRLTDRGWDVHIACRTSDPAQWSHYPELQLRPELTKRIHITHRLPEVIESVRPALVHFEFGMLAIGQIAEARRRGARVLVSFRGSDLSTYGLDDPECYRETWEQADALHLLSADLWRLARRRGCPARKPHVLIPPAVRVEAWQRTRRAPAEAPIGTPDRPLRIVSVGRLAWIKGYGHALSAVRRLQDQGVHCEYRIIGDGPERAGVLFDVHDLGLEGQVRLLGALPPAEVRTTLAWADVFLHAALYEGFCNAALEAQSMALPVVCSDAGALPENVRDEITGFVVPRRDATAMANRLATLARDPALRRRMGSAGRRRVRRSFRAEDQIGRFEQLYRRVLSRRPADVDSATLQLAAADSAPRSSGTNRVTGGASFDTADDTASILARLREVVQQEFPPHARLLVVSRGDNRLLELEHGRAGHFPQTEDGTYAGHHPADSAAAIRQLERLQARGSEYLLFPWTSAWWLDHYRELREHLESKGRLVCYREGTCIIYALGTEAAPQAEASDRIDSVLHGARHHERPPLELQTVP